MNGSETIKETLHKADCVLYPVNGRKDKVDIVLFRKNVQESALSWDMNV